MEGLEYELKVREVERNVLEAELDDHELPHSERYQRLEREIQNLRSKIDT